MQNIYSIKLGMYQIPFFAIRPEPDFARNEMKYLANIFNILNCCHNVATTYKYKFVHISLQITSYTNTQVVSLLK